MLKQDERYASLSHASVSKAFVPEVDLNWEDGVWSPGAGLLPTDQMTLPASQIEKLDPALVDSLAANEVAAFLSAFCRFETLLTQFLARQAYRSGGDNPQPVYIMHIIEEEARHTRMFSRVIEQLGVGAYPPVGPVGWVELGVSRVVLWWAPLFHTALLAVECITDSVLALAAEGSTSHLLRGVCRVHRIEEARHIHYASAEFRSRFDGLGAFGRGILRVAAPLMARVVFSVLAPPQIYRRSGVARSDAASWTIWFQRRRWRAHQRAVAVSRFKSALGAASTGGTLPTLLWRGLEATGH